MIIELYKIYKEIEKCVKRIEETGGKNVAKWMGRDQNRISSKRRWMEGCIPMMMGKQNLYFVFGFFGY